MRASPDDILGMAFFARVVEAQSFSDAARSLGISKSAVSARVARLEERLGVRLLHRTTRRLALTADGVRLYERCARVVAEADEAAEIAAGASAAPRGSLRVHCSAAFATHLTSPLADFMRAYPEVRVELRLSDRAADVAADGLDVSIVVARRLPDSGLLAKKLATSRVTTCAAPSYLRKYGVPFRPQDLVHHECLAPSVAQPEDWRFDTEEGPVSIAATASLVVDDARFLREAALDGAGITMLPDLLVAEDLLAGRLHRVLDDYQSIELAVHAIHAHARRPPASVRALLDHLTACFRRPPWAATIRRFEAASRATVEVRQPAIPITEQDVRRLGAVAVLYADVDADGAARVRHALAHAKVMLASQIPPTSVTMNSRVALRDEAGERQIWLAYPWDARDGRVSVTTEHGRALLGATVGGAFVDGAARRSRIVAVPYQPEAAGDHHL